MQRVRAIIIEAGSIALIERQRDERRYFVFPGGGREAGETPHEAVAREVLEETGLRVEVGREIARVRFPDHTQGFYVATMIGGTFGTGAGPEFTDPAWAGRGRYQPVWIPVAEISRQPIYPEGVAALVLDAHSRGWADRSVSIADGSWAIHDSLIESGNQ